MKKFIFAVFMVVMLLAQPCFAYRHGSVLTADSLLAALFVLVFWIIIFLILRAFWCWYWKINKIVSLLETISGKLTANADKKGGEDV